MPNGVRTLLNVCLLFLLLGIQITSLAQVPNEQDCAGAIVICQNVYNQPNSFSGEGNIPNEIPNTTCLGSGEENNVWYTFTAQTTGNLCFTISPTNPTDDYDWAVFSMEDYDCEDLWDHAGEMVVSCNFNVNPGPTGANGNAGPQNEPCIPVTMGITYTINVSNFSATQFGYILDFSSSSAKIFDDIPPRLGTIMNSPIQCGDDTIRIKTSELVKCKTVETTDFKLNGNGGPYTVSGLGKPNCGFLEDNQDVFEIIVSPPLQANGIYQLILKDGSGFIEDRCGNVAGPDTLQFSVAPLSISMSFNRPSCPNDSDAFAEVTVNSNPGGTFNFYWYDNSGNLIEEHLSKSSPDRLNNIGAGQYRVEVGLCGTGVVFIEDPAGIIDNPIIKSDECSEGSGFVDPNPGGGTPPYTYAWSNGATTRKINNLFSGAYTVDITDATGCVFTKTYDVYNLFQPDAEAGTSQSICAMEYILQATPSQGSGVWTDNSGGAISYPFGNSSPNSTVIANVEGQYTFYWTETNNGCSDTDSIIINFRLQPIANAGEDFISCNLNYFLNPTPSVGSGLWSTPDANVTFADNTLHNTEITVGTPGTYTFIWRELNKGCVDRDTIIGTFYDNPNPNAGPDDKIIGFSYQLSGSIAPSGANILWSSNCVGITIDNPNSSSPTIESTFEGCCELVYEWKFPECSNYDTVRICFVEPPNTDAGIDDSICGFNYQLAPNLSTGNPTWKSLDPGVIFTPNNNTSEPNIMVSSSGVYRIELTEKNDIAVDKDTVVITFFDFPAANAGVDTTICDTLVQLQANAPADSAWWLDSPGLTFNPDRYSSKPIVKSDSYGTFEAIWTNSSNGCIARDTILLTFVEQPFANAGIDDSICGNRYQLNAFPSVGVGSWLNHDSVLFSDQSSPNPTITLIGSYSSYELIWVENNNGCSDIDTVSITFLEIPAPMVSNDTTICGFKTKIWVHNATSPGVWTCMNENVIISDSLSDSTEVDISNISYGTYTFYWTETNAFCTITDSIIVEFNKETLANAGDSDSICGNQYQLQAILSTGTGTWNAKSGTLINANSPNAIFSAGNNFGTHELVWLESNGVCSSSDTLYLTFYEQPTSNAGKDTLFCGLSGELNAQLDIGIGNWSSVDTNLILINPTSENARVDAQNIGFGQYQIIWTEVNGLCQDKDTVLVEFIDAPQAYAGEDDSICGSTYLLKANPSAGQGVWSYIHNTISFSHPDSNITQVSSSQFGNFPIIWTEDHKSCSDLDTVWINFMEQPDAYAGINDTICGLSYQLNANPAVGIGTWTSNTIKSIQDIHQENTIVEVDTFGIHQLIWSDTNQTCFSSDTLEVFFYLGPTATFSVPNQSITTLDLTVPFTNNSIYGENYFWDFDDGINSTEEEPIHTFTSIGFFDILLITYDKYGCSDSSSLSIEVTDDFRVFVPDAFSPNNDQLNDSFKPELIGIRLENYSLIIYDRWGKEVFYTANMDDAWNGKMFNEGKANTQGVYAYKLSFQTFSGDIVTRSGRITLIK